jgi:hypothetical protein
MIAPLRPTLRFEPSQTASPLPLSADKAGDSGVALLVGALGFFSLIPYPSVGIGNTSALQVGNVLTLLMIIPVALLSWRRRPFWVYPLLLAPMLISAAKAGVVGDDVGHSIKAILPWALSALTLWIPQIYARSYALDLLTGVAAAIVLHFGVGLWQLHSFSSGVFPFVELYVNKSFLSVQDNATIIARYTQRPFGIFPEPSAMSSSLAPWILFFAAHFCGVIRLRQTPARWQQVLFGAAAAGGLGLIILSQSGHAAVTLAALLVFAVIWFARCRATLRTYGVIVAVFAAVLPAVLWLAAKSLGNRVGGTEMGNSSWHERSTSLRLGFEMLVDGDYLRVICGMGVGLIGPALWRNVQIEAVYSVLLCYLYETGLIGLLAVGWVTRHLAKVWAAARYNVAFVAIAGVWLVGVTITTSYEQLLPIWLALGWLTVWSEICDPVAARQGPVTNVAVAEVPIPEPGVRWTPAHSGGTLGGDRIERTPKPNKRWTEQ